MQQMLCRKSSPSLFSIKSVSLNKDITCYIFPIKVKENNDMKPHSRQCSVNI